MRPPARTISAARRISRTGGLTGWTSKYGFKGLARGFWVFGLSYAALFFGRFRSRRPSMQSLLDLAPLAAFLVAYKLGGIYVATAVLMASMAVLLIVDYARTRKVSTMHAISAVLVFLFGAATLILHDQRFIQWKPTVLFWLLSVALLGSMWIGKEPLVQRLLGRALDGQVNVPES